MKLLFYEIWSHREENILTKEGGSMKPHEGEVHFLHRSLTKENVLHWIYDVHEGEGKFIQISVKT